MYPTAQEAHNCSVLKLGLNVGLQGIILIIVPTGHRVPYHRLLSQLLGQLNSEVEGDQAEDRRQSSRKTISIRCPTNVRGLTYRKTIIRVMDRSSFDVSSRVDKSDVGSTSCAPSVRCGSRMRNRMEDRAMTRNCGIHMNAFRMPIAVPALIGASGSGAPSKSGSSGAPSSSMFCRGLDGCFARASRRIASPTCLHSQSS